VEAASLELCQLAVEHDLPLRVLLLIDSCERLVNHFAGRSADQSGAEL
jgi:hypothetical protein